METDTESVYEGITDLEGDDVTDLTDLEGDDITDLEVTDLEITDLEGDEVTELEKVNINDEDIPPIPTKYHKKIIIIKPENRRSSDILTKFEMCEIISIRSQQIANDDKSLVDKGTLDDPISIAKKELMERKCPLVLRRKMGKIYNNEKNIFTEYYEYWDVNIMSFPVHYD